MTGFQARDLHKSIHSFDVKNLKSFFFSYTKGQTAIHFGLEKAQKNF